VPRNGTGSDCSDGAAAQGGMNPFACAASSITALADSAHVRHELKPLLEPHGCKCSFRPATPPCNTPALPSADPLDQPSSRGPQYSAGHTQQDAAAALTHSSASAPMARNSPRSLAHKREHRDFRAAELAAGNTGHDSMASRKHAGEHSRLCMPAACIVV
jgi:hypothetical protein